MTAPPFHSSYYAATASELARMIGWHGIDVDDSTVEAVVHLPNGRARCTYTAGATSLRHTACVMVVDHRGWVEMLLRDPHGADCGRIVLNTGYLAVVSILTWASQGTWNLVVRSPRKTAP